LFQDAGYETGYFGKWHLSPGKTFPKSLLHNPWTQGYDESFITFKPSRSLAQDWQTPENDGHSVKLLTRHALDFISRNRSTPFFLTISHNAIHSPLMEREQRIQKYTQRIGADLPQNKPVLGAMIESVDDSVGQILEHLNNLELTENTVVIFYSDNGGATSRKQLQAPLRAGKGWLYEGGIRVPLIVRWPGVVESGSHNYALVTSTDFFPTFIEILDKNTQKHSSSLDGESMVNLLNVQTHRVSVPFSGIIRTITSQV
jgi:arylsulfatase A